MSTTVRRLTGWLGIAACAAALVFLAGGVHLWAVRDGDRRLSTQLATAQVDDYYVTGPVTVGILPLLGVALAAAAGALMVFFGRLAMGKEGQNDAQREASGAE